jgi:subtilase-type proteinase RRT12
VEADSYEFGNRVIFGEDFTDEGSGDHNDHGTCVAGIAGSRTYGVAKEAYIVDVKVIGGNGRGKLSWILRALEYVHNDVSEHRYAALINMSLGTHKNGIFNAAVEELIAVGIPIVVAAGNSDTSACRSSPASARGALVIGAFDDRSDTVASFSNWGQCVDAFAPGVNVRTVAHDGRGSVSYSGTSVSSPMGAGLFAYFTGMGDSGTRAVERAKDLRIKNKLAKTTFMFKPKTDNFIFYNDAGEPLW